MSDKTLRLTDWFLACLMAGVAFTAYAVTRSDGAAPGQSASLLVQTMGLFPQLSSANPIWRGVAGLLARMGDPVSILNWLSVVCGSLAVGLVYRVMAGTVQLLTEESEHMRARSIVAGRLAGVTAALTLAFSTPFWIVSNRAHTASLDLVLLLTCAWLLLKFASKGQEGYALAFGFLYALGIVEFATFIVMAPLAGGFLLFLYWRHERLRVGTMVRLLVVALVGVSLYFLAAWIHWGTEGYKLRGYPHGFFPVVWYMWREQYYLITSSLPREGWLTILVLTVVPWLAAIMVCRRALNEEKDWGYYILHVTLTAIGAAVVLGMPYAPWPLLHFRHLLVTPYLLTAMVMGYLAAYWFLFPSMWTPEGDEEAVGRGKTLGVIGGLLGALFIALTVVAPIRNYKEADARQSGAVNRLAERIVEAVPPGFTWLISDGQLDNHVLLAARKANRSIHVMRIPAGDDAVYQAYVASQFDNVRFKNLAQIGIVSLLMEWFTTDPEVYKKVAVLGMADLWAGTGAVVVPNKLVFLGAAKKEDVPPDLWARHLAFWKELTPELDAMDSSSAGKGGMGFGDRGRRLAGMVANNLGVLQEDLGHREQAFYAYQQARSMDPENVSALLNQWALLNSGHESVQKEAIKRDLDAFAADKEKAKLRIWALSRTYGYVRTPRAFAELGWTWAVSGQPGMAVSGLRRAMDMLPEAQKGELKQTLAAVYLQRAENEKSEKLYQEILSANPQNREALVGLSRLASRQGDHKKAAEYLQKAEKAGIPRAVMATETAALHIMAGEHAKARVVLQEALDMDSSALMAWALMGEVMVNQKDEAGLRECIRKIEMLKGNRGLMVHLRAQLALLQRNLGEARDMFQQALSMTPNNAYVIQSLLKLDMMQDLKDEGLEHARALLRLDPDNSLGNLAMGSLQAMGGQYELAEDSLRRSIKKHRAPEALNELAVVLSRRGAYEEAEPLILEALKGIDSLGALWDTYGVILMKTKRLDEAREAFQKALSMGSSDGEVFLNSAELEFLQGKKEKAMEMLTKAAEGEKRMTQPLLDRMAKLRSQVAELK